MSRVSDDRLEIAPTPTNDAPHAEHPIADEPEGATTTQGGRGSRPPLWWTWLGVTMLLAGVALGAVAAGERSLRWDLEVSRAVQLPAWHGLDQFAWLASRIGDFWPGMVVVSLLAASVFARAGRLDLALFIVLAMALRAGGPLLKWVFSSPRPMVEAVAVLEQSDGFGYPSGHSFGAALLYGAIAVCASRIDGAPALSRAMQWAALAIILLIGISRVRLGVHWPSDVLGGIAFGIGMVCLLQAAFTVWDARRLRN